MQKYNKYKTLSKNQETIKSFDKSNRKSLEDNVIDKSRNKSLCSPFTKYLDETKNESFL